MKLVDKINRNMLKIGKSVLVEIQEQNVAGNV